MILQTRHHMYHCATEWSAIGKVVSTTTGVPLGSIEMLYYTSVLKTMSEITSSSSSFGYLRKFSVWLMSGILWLLDAVQRLVAK